MPIIVSAAVLALVITAVAAFQWGAGDRPTVQAATPSPTPEAPERLTVGEVYQAMLPSVVAIRSTTAGAQGGATGTGVIVNAEAAILTALHVVEGATSIEVAFADGTLSAAEIVGAAPAMDIALLIPEKLPELIVPAVLGGGPSIGDDVIAIGNPLGLNYSTTAGVVSGLGRTVRREAAPDIEGVIQFDAAVNPGSSGGPLVNTRAEIVGIVVALANPTEDGTFIGIGFAVPIATAVTAGGDQPPPL